MYNFFKKTNALTQKRYKKRVSEVIAKRVTAFFKKKVPVGDKYPYKIYDPFLVLGEDTGYERFYLVGENWQNNPQKPIAIVLGCNDWKYGFISDYLPDFRVAFGSRTLVGLNAILAMVRLTHKPSQIAIWGYTEDIILSSYLKINNIKIWRIEDGFVRSSDLGASHATPYSLIFDKTGFYYNCHKPSDVEILLNEYDFASDPTLIKQAENALKKLLDLKISKYNPTSLQVTQDIKTRKRVAILGQVDNDAAIRMGNPNNWTYEELIKLAKYEHPDAEVIYRPHPDVFAGYQKSRFKRRRVEYFAQISSPEENIIDFIEKVDHVYTITSLSGLEALLRGKTVTVVGAPFYSNWGLTDDRVKIDRRQRSLSLLELFAGIYLLYPKYLADLNDGAAGISTTMSKIVSDKEFNYLNLDLEKVASENSITSCNITLRKHFSDKNLLEKEHIVTLFRKYGASGIDQVLLNLFWGKFNDVEQKKAFIHSVRHIVNKNDLGQFLYDISFDIEDTEINLWIAHLLNESNETPLAKEVLKHTKEKPTERDSANIEYDANINTEASYDPLVDENKLKRLKVSLDISIKEYDYTTATKTLLTILRHSGGSINTTVHYLNTLANIFYDSFQIAESLATSELSYTLAFKLSNRRGYRNYLDALFITESYDLTKKLDSVMVLLKSNPELITYCTKFFDRGSVEADYLEKSFYLDKEYTVSKLMGLTELSNSYQANMFFEEINKKFPANIKVLKVYTDLLHSQNKTKEAISILEKSLLQNLNEVTLKQTIKLLNFTSNFTKAKFYMDTFLSSRFEANSTLFTPIFLGMGDIKKGYETYLHETFVKDLTFLLGNNFRKINSTDDISFEPDTVILAMYGPGDEIRFASIYPDLASSFKGKSFAITCDERLHSLFSRSFPQIEFISANRTRNLDKDHVIENYNELPSMKLTTLLDNESYHKLDKFKHIYVSTDFIAKYRDKYSAFPGNKYLIPNKDLVAEIQKKLPSNKILVGLNWRSSLTNFTRMEHYLTIEEISPVFKTNKNIQFVNLQYDNCDKEIKWVEENFPGKLINLKDIDQYNDFESVAALMSCLDLIVAPCTSVIELAGALGRNAYLLSNSGEINWRKKDNKSTDVWHNSVTIIDVVKKGDKKELVSELCSRLEALS